MLFNALAALGHRGIKTTATFGRAGLMLFNAVVGKPEFRKHAPLLVRQLYNVGVLSMLIIIVSGLFIGMVLGLQGYLVLTTYSAETSLGMLVALSLLRELGHDPQRVAVEKNGSIVPRAAFAEEKLADADHLEVVCFVGGG